MLSDSEAFLSWALFASLVGVGMLVLWAGGYVGEEGGLGVGLFFGLLGPFQLYRTAREAFTALHRERGDEP